ncbi:hypothetical protein TSAR_012446 [Trichomalopsis sarcophagae]|uniref:Uncharacterized protein n=1 Tax=Trichomalopsis sarcophagae TaxID=543379 RepID=A0A232F618_9HYME|nr:hypothetical protein TSAR_012446 [Trichomalopsis sarcophagae]
MAIYIGPLICSVVNSHVTDLINSSENTPLVGSETCKQFDQLPILLSSGSIIKLIDVIALENSKGESIAHATHNALLEWGCTEIVQAKCCATTNSNFIPIVYFPAVNGADIPIFKRFQNYWNAIQTAEINNGLKNLEPFLLA